MNFMHGSIASRSSSGWARGLVTGILVAVLCGCASVRSYKLDESAIPDSKQGGVTYYLPIRYAEVTFERRLILDKPQTTIDAAKAAQDKAEKAAKETKRALDEANFRLTQIRSSGVPGTAAAYQRLALAEIEAKLAHAAAEAAVSAAKAAYAKAVADHHAWESAKSKCGYADRFSITLHKPVADTRHRFSLHMAHSILRKDKWVYSTTSDGLLSTVQGTVQDQTAEILVAAARSSVATEDALHVQQLLRAGDRKNLLRALDSIKPVENPADPCNLDWKPLLIQRTFDPARNAEWNAYFAEVNRMAKVECRRGIACDPQSGAFHYALSSDFPDAPEVSIPPGTRVDGLYYRRELPLLARIEERGTFAGAFMLTLPNPSPVEFIPLKHSAMVTTQHNLGFDRGMLVSVDSERPSELMRAVAIPWDVATAVIGASTDLVKFRVDYAKGNTDLIREQTRLLEELKEQLDAQRALDDARADDGEDDPDP